MSDMFCSQEINFEKSDVVLNVLTKKCCLKDLQRNSQKLKEKKVNCTSSLLKNGQQDQSPSVRESSKPEGGYRQDSKPTFKYKSRKETYVKIYSARLRPDVDLLDYLGKYEFSAASRSIFTEECDLIRSKDKSKINSDMFECLPVIKSLYLMEGQW